MLILLLYSIHLCSLLVVLIAHGSHVIAAKCSVLTSSSDYKHSPRIFMPTCISWENTVLGASMSELLHKSNRSLFLLGVIFIFLTILRQACGDESPPDAWINPQAEGGEVLSPPSHMMGSSLTLEWKTDFATEYVLLYANDGNPNHYEVVLS